MKKTKFFIFIHNTHSRDDRTLEFENFNECLSELKKILEVYLEVYSAEYKEFKPDKKEIEDMTCGLYKVLRIIKGIRIKREDGMEQILYVFEGVEEKKISGRIIPLGDGTLIVLIYLNGEIRAVAELTPTDFEEVWRFFTYGFDLKGNPFMEAGYVQGGYDYLSEEDVEIFKDILKKGTLSEWASRRKKYNVKKSTIIRRLQEAKRKYLGYAS